METGNRGEIVVEIRGLQNRVRAPRKSLFKSCDGNHVVEIRRHRRIGSHVSELSVYIGRSRDLEILVTGNQVICEIVRRQKSRGPEIASTNPGIWKSR